LCIGKWRNSLSAMSMKAALKWGALLAAILATSNRTQAELPPSAYWELQEKAPGSMS
jgi:hypothetical protein